jgi:lysophospholipase L1-like esterase
MRRGPYKRWLLATFAVLLGLPLLVEAGLRLYYYQRHGPSTFALVQAYRSGEGHANMVLAELQRRQHPEVTDQADDAPIDRDLLFTNVGTELLDEVKERYENHFAAMVEDLRRDGVKLLVLRLPAGYQNEQTPANQAFRPFIRNLCGRYGVEFLDIHEAAFNGISDERVTLMPENGHLSRFGHILVSDALAPLLDRLASHRAHATFSPGKRPERFGDLRPDLDEVWSPEYKPYRLVTNHQGLRMNHDLTFPKQRQRILFLGDSITFAAYVNHEDSYPGMLEKRFPDREFMNAGHASYTVSDYLSLWRDRARYSEPDIVVLQTHANDLTDFLSSHRNSHDRDGRLYVPSEAERSFIETVRAQRRKTPGNARP